MSSMNPIATTKIASTTAAQQPQALQGSSSGVFATALGANFFEMIIARMAASTEAGDIKAGAKADATIAANAAAITNATPAQPQNPLAMLQVALASQTVDADGNLVLPTGEEGTDKIKSQLDFTNQIINHLKTMLSDTSDKEGVFAKVMAKLQAKSDTLQASLSALENGVIAKNTAVEDIPLPLLISLGLSPSQISQVTDKINELEKKLGRDITVEDLIAGVGGIVPPAPETTVLASVGLKAAKETSLEDASLAADSDAEPSDDLAAKLNALNVGGEEPTDEKGEKRVMKGLPEVDTTVTKDATPADSTVKKPTANFKDHIVNLLNTDKATQGDMIFPVSQFNGDADAAIFQPYGMTPTPGLSLGTTAQASNLIATSATAGQAHPATNMVAANIVKFAAQGENQTMQIRLDPPELGNVSIRLQFGKDKAVKAHLTVEKPETYMMLQRDGHALERALQSAGLDANANSISFELANQDNNPSRNNGEGGNDNNFGGGNAGSQNASAGDEIIQSSVTWQVDPSTGHVRYNLFA